MIARTGKQRRTDDGGDGWGDHRRTLAGLLAFTSRGIAQELHRRLAATAYPDIRPGDGNVFEHVGPEGSTVSAMAARAGISAQAMVEIVDSLQARGYVERVPDPRDRRAKRVRLTDEGRRADQIGREVLGQIEAEWAQRFGRDRIADLRATLAEVATDLRAPAPRRR